MLSDSTMAQQKDGWPLGLRLMNDRMAENHDLSASVSFNTLRTHSPSSFTDSSSDLDTESTASFYHDKSITLGSLIGVSSIFELSQRSTEGNKVEILEDKKKYKSKPCEQVAPVSFALAGKEESRRSDGELVQGRLTYHNHR
ncbi:uncharacterized protein LOC120090965 isoform X4 [Benincasa hispida]|uniref:uncharacterized protein LOC120090965 isoform X4 n=1 Tax=Benincasa hispida TaxID=102211 RepID=UPI0019027596|nr:uncharacterized protein LOC120090965 isoform X4 [Benincasa hispida]